MKGRVKRVSLTFSAAEYREFEAAAKASGEKPSSHIKALAVQALRNEVALPDTVDGELAEVSRLIRTIANNVNQMARHSNRIAHVLDEHEVFLHIAALQDELKRSVTRAAAMSSRMNPGSDTDDETRP